MNHPNYSEMFNIAADLDFRDIPESQRLNPDRRLNGLLYLQSKLLEPSKFWTDWHAEHDELHLSSVYKLACTLSQEDVDYLNACGICWDSSNNYFYMFV
jgi:hypothetical protein